MCKLIFFKTQIMVFGDQTGIALVQEVRESNNLGNSSYAYHDFESFESVSTFRNGRSNCTGGGFVNGTYKHKLFHLSLVWHEKVHLLKMAAERHPWAKCSFCPYFSFSEAGGDA